MTAIDKAKEPRVKDSPAKENPAASPAAKPAMTPLQPPAGAPTVATIWRAHDTIRGKILDTPMLHSRTFSSMTGAEVHLKAENLQRAGSFKIRGATYKMAQLTEEERSHGVIAASAGNHAQGVAIAARSYQTPCTIVMPAGAPMAKVLATQGYGATVELFGESYDDAYARALEIQKESGATFVHAFNDPNVIAGQGTIGIEILHQIPDVDAILVPIGGGGLISGIAIAAKSLKPEIEIIGVQAAGAPSAMRSLEAGHIVPSKHVETIADGISTKRPGDLTFSIIQRYVNRIVTVEDEDTASAILLLLERSKLFVEGAGAVTLAALLKPGLLDLTGKKVVVLLSGGNIDMNLVGRFIEFGMAAQGRILMLHTAIPDRPGALMQCISLVAKAGVNVREIQHSRAMPFLPIQEVEVTMTLETKNRTQAEQVMAMLREHGYRVAEIRSLYDAPVQ